MDKEALLNIIEFYVIAIKAGEVDTDGIADKLLGSVNTYINDNYSCTLKAGGDIDEASTKVLSFGCLLNDINRELEKRNATANDVININMIDEFYKTELDKMHVIVYYRKKY